MPIRRVGALFTLAVAALLLVCARAHAAPAVQPDPRRPSTDTYDDAAAHLNVPEWGTSTNSRTVVHVLFRLAGDRATLTVLLPPDVPVQQGEQRLAELADAMRWKHVRLYSRQEPDSLVLRAVANDGAHVARTGSGTADLSVGLLRRKIADLTALPVLLAVRCAGVDALTSNGTPLREGVEDDSRVLFYRLYGNQSFTPETLTFHYSLSSRRLAALVTVLLLLLLAPPLGLLAVREFALRLPAADPAERLRVFRRWQRVLRFSALAVPVGLVPFVGLQRLLFLFGTLANPAIVLVGGWLALTVAWSLGGRLIGLPLERAAFPQRAHLPWYRAASLELVSAAFTLVFGGIGLAAALPVVTGGATRSPVLLAAFVVAPVLLFAGSFGWVFWKVRRARKKGATRPEEGSSELLVQVRPVVERAGCTVERVVIRKPIGSTSFLPISVTGGAVFITEPASRLLAPDQIGALAAAALLNRRISPLDRRIDIALSAVTLVPAVAFLGLLTAHFLFPTRVHDPFVFMFPMLAVQFLASPILQRRRSARSDAADRQAAEALGDPGRLLAALSILEQNAIAEGALDPVAAQRLPIAQRRRRLEKHLGMGA